MVMRCECGWQGVPLKGGGCPVCVGIQLTEREWAEVLAERPLHELMAEQIARKAGLTQRRVEASPGRNDPCSCGSGRKFKRCCGA